MKRIGSLLKFQKYIFRQTKGTRAYKVYPMELTSEVFSAASLSHWQGELIFVADVMCFMYEKTPIKSFLLHLLPLVWLKLCWRHFRKLRNLFWQKRQTSAFKTIKATTKKQQQKESVTSGSQPKISGTELVLMFKCGRNQLVEVLSSSVVVI